MGTQGVVQIRPSDAPVAATRAPRASGTSQQGLARAAMVGWYRPLELARTGLSILTSTLFGRNADERVVEALKAAPLEYYDYSKLDSGDDRDALWLDYVADAGDGFDSTYAVARAVALPELTVEDDTRAKHPTQRGRVLVFGGDTVYPVASREQYEQRLVMPYEHALPSSAAPHPDVYAIPGNHDWYDSLVAFTRRFCSQRWFAGWRTHQKVSYFALKLPGDWWLLGTDVQLDSDIDADQVAYFKAIAALLGPGARIILCNAEPHWIYQHKYGGAPPASDSNLRFLEDQVFQRRISVFLAGDLHHYRRHSDATGHHKIVAGGGGAFLHPTHDCDVSTLAGPSGPYKLENSYPEIAASRRLTWGNWKFLALNPGFGVVTALLYLLTCRAVQVDVTGLGLGEVAYRVLCEALRGPTTLIWILALVGGVILFTDTHSTRYRIVAGGLHALGHLIAVFFIGWGAACLVSGWHLAVVSELLVTGALVFVAGWIAGSMILAAYLTISLNRFGRHDTEAFSALAIADFKNFLRLHITRDRLTIYPIGIDRVARRWAKAIGAPILSPADPRATAPRLIDGPIVIAREAA